MYLRRANVIFFPLQHGRDGRVPEGDPRAAGATARREQAEHQALAAGHCQGEHEAHLHGARDRPPGRATHTGKSLTYKYTLYGLHMTDHKGQYPKCGTKHQVLVEILLLLPCPGHT